MTYSGATYRCALAWGNGVSGPTAHRLWGPGTPRFCCSFWRLHDVVAAEWPNVFGAGSVVAWPTGFDAWGADGKLGVRTAPKEPDSRDDWGMRAVSKPGMSDDAWEVRPEAADMRFETRDSISRSRSYTEFSSR